MADLLSGIWARLEKTDNLYHYGVGEIASNPELGPLYAIQVNWTGRRVDLPGTTASPDEHERWLEVVKEAGNEVVVGRVE